MRKYLISVMVEGPSAVLYCERSEWVITWDTVDKGNTLVLVLSSILYEMDERVL